jgi:SNF2 family DNA or RNA helicase
MVENFFSDHCPVIKTGLNISVQSDESLSIVPDYPLNPDYAHKRIHFFDTFVYVEGEGFSELPTALMLPERFREETIITKEQLSWFFSYDFPALQNYFITIDPKLLKPIEMQLLAKSIVKGSFGKNNTYQLKIGYQTERGFIPLSDIWWAIQKKKEYLFSKAGLLTLNERTFDWVRRIQKKAIRRSDNTLHLSTLELMRLLAMEHIFTVHDSSKSLLENLENCVIPSDPHLFGLQGQMRPYQLLGIKWLWFLYLHGLSGLLCDDMGLGKTHQAMALIAAVLNAYKIEPTSKKPYFLTVCPTSVICHWEEKLAQFFPGLRVLTFYGSDRSLKGFEKNYDLILTSYGVLRQEHQKLMRISFEIAVFDEIQIAKNAQSRIHALLLSLKAGMRLGLTGTPIENYLRELKSLFDIVLPTYMPAEREYRELFIKPIEKANDRQQRMLLKRLIHPFMLRRKKEDVLTDLPEKTEEIVHCHFSLTQRLLYQEVLHRLRDPLMEQLEEEGIPVPYMHIFSLLSRLKQICNHPAAYFKKPLQYKEYESGKWELFLELFREAQASQQKIVIFSQYLAMLDIFVAYMTEIGVEFAMIRGDTKDRGTQIHRFNHDPSCKVFIGSLLTAGLGVDLTAGSVVIHYDRWWNAAREQQATDRVHRIGQTRGVQVFKLVTKDSFEERIDKLIERKRMLFENVVAVDDHLILKQFDRKELIQLLQDIPSTPLYPEMS